METLLDAIGRLYLEIEMNVLQLIREGVDALDDVRPASAMEAFNQVQERILDLMVVEGMYEKIEKENE